MSINTDLATSPYFDDFDEEKNFHRILFRPAVAVQARELTQLQTILQNQVERFGENILKQGTIVKGCNFTFLEKYAYVKLLDQNTSGENISPNAYVNARAVGLTTGVTAKVVNAEEGLESQAPNLNTIYVKYLTTGNGEIKTFSSTENIEIRNFDTDALITTVSAGGTIDGNSIGNGYALTVNDGVIFQRGNFIRVENQTAIVSKYSTEPDGLRAGFKIDESIIDSNEDTSLLDNASGFNNFNAPGAHRLKLSPTLTVLSTANAEADAEFFSLVDFESGDPVRIRDLTQYAVIGDTMARRTSEESGNYTVNAFPLSMETNADNPNTQLSAVVGAGLAYVDGYRVESFYDSKIDVNKATAFETEQEQTVTTNYGHYVIVDEMFGSFDFNEAGEVSLHDTAQNRATAGSVGTKPSGQIGTANIRSLTYEDGTLGDANAQYRAYLYNIQMSSNSKFEDVRNIFYDGTDKGSADTVLEGSPAKAVIKDFSFKKSIFPIGREAVKALSDTDFVYRTVDKTLSVSTGGAVTITLSDGEWPYGVGALNSDQKKEIILIADATQSPYTDGEPIDLTGATVTISSSTTMDITGITAPAATLDIVAYYNVKKTAASPALKESKNVFIKIDAANNVANTVGPYCLGLPDVYEIVNVWKGSTFANTETDVTSSFRLITGQTDTFYGLSYIKPNKNLSIGASDKILVEAKVFQKNTSSGDGFFSIDSYYNIDVEDIPIYTAESGVRYFLRDSVDFRTYASNTAAYSTTIAGATEDPDATLSFPSGEKFFATPNKDFETDYEYYLGRKDRIIVDRDGRFSVIEGVPSEYPVLPSVPSSCLALGNINVPPFPSLTPLEAASAGKPSYGTVISLVDNKGYKMKDIGAIERRLEALEYYTALSALETDTRNFNITDENGLDRFKNGILVDPFVDLSIAEVDNEEFNASIDPSFQEIGPSIRQYDIPLKVANTNNVTVSNGAATLFFTDSVMFSQPYATKTRNSAQDFYQFTGSMVIDPELDNFYDVTVAPRQTVTVDSVVDFTEVTSNFNNQVPLRNVTQDVVNRTVRSGAVNTTNPRGLLNTTATNISPQVNNRVNTPVNEFVTDVRFNPYMRSREVRVYVTGLRPNTRHYFFFDETDVNVHVANAVENIAGQTGVNALVRSSDYDPTDGVSSDANGVLRAIFRIPPETFFVGDRILKIYDVNTLSSSSSSTSNAKARYVAFNIEAEKSNLEIVQNVTVRREFNREVRRDRGNGGNGGGDDPLAQTFFIKQNYAPSDSVVMVTKADLYFQSKSDTLGFTAMIREVENGYPTEKVVPFSKVHVDTSDINVSDDGTEATIVRFSAPVALKNNTEYALIVKPDQNSPDFNLFVSKVGESDLSTGVSVTQDWGDGTLFTSTNDRAWTPYQDENLKFTIHRANFTASTGNVELTSDNVEFLSIDGINGNFNKDEYVYVNATPVASETVAVTEGNNTIIGTNTAFVTDFNIGEHIVVVNSTDYDVYKIKAITNNTVMTTEDIPKFSNTTCDYFKSIVGKVYYFNSNESRLHLYKSSANSTDYFEANAVVVGADSGASATISEVVDQAITYIQPSIVRVNYPKTTNSFNGEFTKTIDDTQFSKELAFGENNYLTRFESHIMSRTNELINGTGNTFTLDVGLNNSTTANTIFSSPFVNVKGSSCAVIEGVLNNDNTNEDTNDGEATAKYISRSVELADGLDAEDIKVYLTAYRPPTSDVEVYVKFKHFSDTDLLEDKAWTKLTRKTETNGVSSAADRFNFYEYEYNIPSLTPPATYAGYLNADGVLTYDTPGGATFETYKYFQIKIVMLSAGHHRVPRIKDMRAIALSA